MISFNGAIIANPKIARFVHPIHSPKDRVFQIGYDNETREKVRSHILQILRISTKASTRPPKYSEVPYSTCCTEKIVVNSNKIKSIKTHFLEDHVIEYA